MSKVCFCGKELVGRKDKKYCNKLCRFKYNKYAKKIGKLLNE